MSKTVPGDLTLETFLTQKWVSKPSIRLRNTSDLVKPWETPQNFLVAQTKECVTCKNTVNEQDSCYLIWEDMCFCDTICLHWYQKQNLIETCSNCFRILPAETIGKYVFRFDQLLQFCTKQCFHCYRAMRKSCLYCMGKILTFSYRVSQHDPNYCSQDCAVKHLKARGVAQMPLQSQSPCHVCKSPLHPITIQYQVGDELKNICNTFCLQTFVLSNQVKPVQCGSCKTYFTPTPLTVIVTHENSIRLFCSKKCETFNVFCNLKVYPCGYCNTNRFDTDLIKRYSKIEPVAYLCSIECYLKKYSASQQYCTPQKLFINVPTTTRNPLSPIMENPEESHTQSTVVVNSDKTSNISLTKYDLAQSNTQNVPTQLKTCFIVKSGLPPEQKNVATMCSVQKADKSSCVKPKAINQYVQTDPQASKKILVPVPVPIYVATPMHMYSVPLPSPVPFPLPIPVPIFIPTTRKGSMKIFDDIKKIMDKIPNNPEEADVLAMAEAVSMDANKDLENDLAMSEQAVNEMFSDDLLDNSSNLSNENTGVSSTVDSIGEIACAITPNLTMNTFKPYKLEEKKNGLETCLGIHAWRQWTKSTKLFFTDPDNIDILKFSPKEVGSCLALFVNDVKRPNGRNYAPDTIFYLCLSIQKYLYENNRLDNIFFDSCYKYFVESLNDQMKTFSMLFLNSTYIVTRVEEEHLWDSRQLGAHSPYVLLNTILYHNMKYFNLMSVEENMSLSLSSIMRLGHKIDDTKTVLRLYKDQEHYNEMPQNLELPERCPVRLFEFYCLKLQIPARQSVDRCYFEPEAFCVGYSPVWYSVKPLEKDELEVMINRLQVVKELNISIEIDD